MILMRLHIHADDKSQADAFTSDLRDALDKALDDVLVLHPRVTIIEASEDDDDDDQG